MRRPTCLAAPEEQEQELGKELGQELPWNGEPCRVWAKVMRAILETSRNLCLAAGKGLDRELNINGCQGLRLGSGEDSRVKVQGLFLFDAYVNGNR